MKQSEKKILCVADIVDAESAGAWRSARKRLLDRRASLIDDRLCGNCSIFYLQHF